MRQKRAKAYRKLMNLYHLAFGFRQPYQVLIDSNLCTTAMTLKMELVKQFGIVLQGNVKPMITQCCIVELYKQGPTGQPAVDLAKTFERRKCNHREAIPGEECLLSVIGESNQHRYVIASQSQPLRAKLRSIPGVPLVHVKQAVMVLEPPSDETLRKKNDAEEQALHPQAPELAHLPRVPVEVKKKKRKGPKAPNPLSCLKKKPKPDLHAIAKAEKLKMGNSITGKAKIGEKRKRADEGDEAVHGNGGLSPKRKKRRQEVAQPSGTGEG